MPQTIIFNHTNTNNFHLGLARVIDMDLDFNCWIKNKEDELLPIWNLAINFEGDVEVKDLLMKRLMDLDFVLIGDP